MKGIPLKIKGEHCGWSLSNQVSLKSVNQQQKSCQVILKWLEPNPPLPWQSKSVLMTLVVIVYTPNNNLLYWVAMKLHHCHRAFEMKGFLTAWLGGVIWLFWVLQKSQPMHKYLFQLLSWLPCMYSSLVGSELQLCMKCPAWNVPLYFNFSSALLRFCCKR